jgi:maltokinase
VTALAGGLAAPGHEQQDALRRVLARWREHHGDPALGDEGAGDEGSAGGAGGTGSQGAAHAIELVAVEVLVPGRPGVVDVLATIDGRLAHAVLGLRRPGDETHVVGSVEEPALGLVEDELGMAVVVDALHDADAARVLLEAVAGEGAAPDHRVAESHRAGREPGTEVVTMSADDGEVTTLSFAHRCSLSVFSWPHPGPHPGVTLLVGLDEAGFNHMAAPIAVWRRAGMDLGVVQELLSGAAGGWALALTSLRDLFASGVAPEAAGGDFASEARSLGVMAARMHLALDRAFGRRPGDLDAWVGRVEEAVAHAPAGMFDTDAVREAVAALRAADLRLPTLRTHGDFHLGRMARTDHGWVVADCMPGGARPGSDDPVYRSPLADVADMVWSLGHAARSAAAESVPPGVPASLAGLADAWAARNRRAFLAGYLSTPGIGGLVPGDREQVRRVVALFEIIREARLARDAAA